MDCGFEGGPAYPQSQIGRIAETLLVLRLHELGNNRVNIRLDIVALSDCLQLHNHAVAVLAESSSVPPCDWLAFQPSSAWEMPRSADNLSESSFVV